MPTEKPVFKLKNIFNQEVLKAFAQSVKQHWVLFPTDSFLNLVFDKTWEDLELKERMRHISSCLKKVLPENYEEAVDILLTTTKGFISEQGEKMLFEHNFLPDFVERFGLDYPNTSIPALAEITRWTSSEFAVRPYLLKYPDRMYAQMLAWSEHASPNIRRLASEGFRPRLPWGLGVPILKKEPNLILPVLENLKHDPAETVRRSVANNLNDISKDHPDLVLEIAARWKGNNTETDWIVRHACRGLLKKGHPAALQLFGFNPDLSTVKTLSFKTDAEVKIGERFHFSFTLVNQGDQPAMIRLEYTIDYQTLSGKISHKVFKISEFLLEGKEQKSFARNQRFQDFTTRKHYPGKHRIAILVNGAELVHGKFEVTP